MAFIDLSELKSKSFCLLYGGEIPPTFSMEDLSKNLGVYLHAEKKTTGQFGHTPCHSFVVTKVTCHKEQSTLLGHQHIYVLLKIQPHPSQPQPSWSHTFIKVYQEIPYLLTLGFILLQRANLPLLIALLLKTK